MNADALRCRFESYTVPEPNTGCLFWIGATTGAGYGHLRASGKMRLAHHVALELAGRQAPRHELGEVAMHTCDHPTCVNHAHLRVGTRADNSRDMVAKERQARGEAHGSARLSDEEVAMIREAAACFETHASIAKSFGVSPRHVGRIVGGTRRAFKGAT